MQNVKVTRPCTVAGCQGTMYFHDRFESADAPHTLEWPWYATWVCAEDPAHFQLVTDAEYRGTTSWSTEGMTDRLPGRSVIVENGVGEKFVVPLGAEKTTFGANRVYSHVLLHEPDPNVFREVAKQHFWIEWDAASETHIVVDTGRYPLRINGVPFDKAQRVRTRTLSPGDIIEIGRFKITYGGGDEDVPARGSRES